MKTLLTSLALTVALGAAALAGPMPRKEIPADAKWLVHVDLDSLRTTKLGEYLSSLLDKDLAKPQIDLKAFFNFDLDWRKIYSLTAYGTDYAEKPDNGVLLIQTDLAVQKGLDEAIAKQESALSDPTTGNIKRLQGSPIPVYSLKDESYAAIHPGGLLVLSKSRARLDRAGEVIAGKSPNLAGAPTFSEYPEPGKSFFFLGLAQGLGESTAVPPQAKVLQMADGGRLVLGESGENIFVNLALKAKTSELATQIQQVVQGMVALATLSQSENQDLQRLAQSLKVSLANQMVMVSLDFPLAKIIDKIKEDRVKKGKD